MKAQMTKTPSNRSQSSELIELATFGAHPLLVDAEDPIFAAALDFVCGGNVLLTGGAGRGKTVRAQALLLASNYPKLLKGTRLEAVSVEIFYVAVDLIPILANSELVYENRIENGTSLREPAPVARFLLKQGWPRRDEMIREEAHRRQVMRTGKGRVRVTALLVDDFDRSQQRFIQNSFMKFIEDARHDFPFCGETRHLNLQCIATTNATVGGNGRGGPYIGSQGVDLAIFNRFHAYHVSQSDQEQVLRVEFSQQAEHTFIEKLVQLAQDIRQEIREGSLTSVGEVTLRQLRPICEQHYYLGLPQKKAAAKLLAAVSRESEEYEKAEELLNTYFGETRARFVAF